MNNSIKLSEEEQRILVTIKASEEKLIDFANGVDKKYQANWHHELIATKLQEAYEKVKAGKRARIILELPPRHGKSNLASIKFPAWVLGKNPEWQIIVVSYAQDLATDFGLETRDLVNSNNYQRIFDTRLRPDTQAKSRWLTKQNGGYTAVGIGGPIVGRGFNIGIIDDPIKNREEADSLTIRERNWKWYLSTFLTREDGNGAIVIIMTRWHDDDLVGRILKDEKERGIKEWEVIKFPAIAESDEEFRKKGEAIWVDRFPLSILEKRKIELGPHEWGALYQQDPVFEEQREFKKEWFKHRNLDEIEKLNTRRFVTIDPASALRDKSDYIGITINYVDSENNWNLRAFRTKINSMELINLIFKLYQDIRFEKIGIEEGAYKTTLQPFLEEEMRKRGLFFKVEELKHRQQEKILRIRGLIPRYSSNSIFHIENFCSDLEEELIRFPKGAIDDTADACAYQLQIAERPERAAAEELLRIQRIRERRKKFELL